MGFFPFTVRRGGYLLMHCGLATHDETPEQCRINTWVLNETVGRRLPGLNVLIPPMPKRSRSRFSTHAYRIMAIDAEFSAGRCELPTLFTANGRTTLSGTADRDCVMIRESDDVVLTKPYVSRRLSVDGQSVLGLFIGAMEGADLRAMCRRRSKKGLESACALDAAQLARSVHSKSKIRVSGLQTKTGLRIGELIGEDVARFKRALENCSLPEMLGGDTWPDWLTRDRPVSSLSTSAFFSLCPVRVTPVDVA